jgi:hypothetical protein
MKQSAPKSIAVPRFVMVKAKPPTSRGGSPFDVHDGKGHAVQRVNSHFRALLRTVHEAYKGTNKWCEKRSIAKAVYMDVTRKGGRFLDANKEPKSEVDAMKKIMKSLKDMPARPTLKPSKEVLDTLPLTHYVSGADFTHGHPVVPGACGLSTFSTERACRDDNSIPVVPTLDDAMFLHFIQSSSHDETDAREPVERSVVPSDTPRCSVSVSTVIIGGGRCHAESINSIATFDIADEEGEWQSTPPADRFRWSTPKSSGYASAAPRTSLQNSLFEISGRLSNELDMFQEGQISLENFLGLGDHAKVPSIWQQVSL